MPRPMEDCWRTAPRNSGADEATLGLVIGIDVSSAADLRSPTFESGPTGGGLNAVRWHGRELQRS